LAVALSGAARRPAVKQRTTNVSATRSNSRTTSNKSSVWDIGLDVGDRKSHYCMIEKSTGEVREGQVATTAEALRNFFEPLATSRVVLEVGSQSRWIQKFLRELGMDAITCEARKSSEVNKHKRKTNRIDARTLAELLRANLPFLSKVEHRSDEDQRIWTRLRCRDALVGVRTKLINLVRGVSKSNGIVLSWCQAECFGRKNHANVPEALKEVFDPIFTLLAEIKARIDRYDRQIEEEATKRPEAQLLAEIPGVGSLTAVAFLVAVGNIRRFRRSRDVGAYLGLVPKERSTGDDNPQLGISKRGNSYARKLLVQAAHYTIGKHNKKDTDLRRWGLAHAGNCKNQKKRAVVAVARKLAVVMAAMLRSGNNYIPLRDDLARKIPA
jgi:transposase